MDPTRFDDLARALSTQPTRRGVLRLLAGSALGALLGGTGARQTAAQTCTLVGGNCTTRACCAGARCAAGKCVCKAGFTACRVTAAGGQNCFDLATDERHCGACATRCDAAAQTCSSGHCCPAAQPTFCVTNPTSGAGVCTNPQTNRNHCGTCGTRCTTSVANATPVCRAGACGFACNSGFKLCNGGCVAQDACCGGCTAPQTCGGGGTPGQCGCTPDCAGKCGGAGDGCGGSCDATCTAPQTCGGGGTPGQCGCTSSATSCADVGANCGSITDNCGVTVGCGQCTLPQTCGGGGTDNVCGCTPDCTGKACGADNGCGSPCQTGSCAGSQICQSGQCVAPPNFCMDGASRCNGNFGTFVASAPTGTGGGPSVCVQARSVNFCVDCSIGSVPGDAECARQLGEGFICIDTTGTHCEDCPNNRNCRRPY